MDVNLSLSSFLGFDIGFRWRSPRKFRAHSRRTIETGLFHSCSCAFSAWTAAARSYLAPHRVRLSGCNCCDVSRSFRRGRQLCADVVEGFELYLPAARSRPASSALRESTKEGAADE